MDPSKLSFLQNVLRYSTSHTPTGNDSSADPPVQALSDTPANSNSATTVTREMSPERKKWLEHALSSMSINPIDEMKKCIKVIVEDEETPRIVEALETLKDWCEDINFAIDFHKLNGYSLLPGLLNNASSEVRALTCELIGTLAQNNPYCQESLIESKILPLMLFKLDKDASDEVKIKAMFAISCMTRDFELGHRKLLEGNGLDVIIKALGSPVEKLQIKCCFLCSSICNNKNIKNALTKKNLIQTLIEMYRQPESNIHEHILSAISVLIDDNPTAVRQAKDMKEINFKQILTQRIQMIADQPPHDEERQMATTLFESLFQN